MTRTLLVRIRGQVQGVGYRAWTEEKARSLGLSGWVRNRRDGSVEAVFSGETAKVDEMVGYCWQGPMAARVDAVDAEAAAAPMQLGFRMLPTA